MAIATPLSLARAPADSVSDEFEADALARVKAGDSAACVAFVRHYERCVFALLGRMFRPRGLENQVEDLAQETFLRVFRALNDFDLDGPAKLSSWILCIASRLAINVIKSAAKKRSLMTEENGGLEVGVPPDQYRVDAEQALRRAIELLSPEQQAALVLREFHGLDDVAIGEALGLRPGAVRARIFRARVQLREQMGREVLS